MRKQGMHGGFAIGIGPGCAPPSECGGNDGLVGAFTTGGLFTGIPRNNCAVAAFSLEVDDRSIAADRLGVTAAETPTKTVHSAENEHMPLAKGDEGKGNDHGY